MKISKNLRWNIGVLLVLPITLLLLGVYHGLMQVIYRAGLISQSAMAGLDYYQGLTLHGVINAVVLTTFFGVAMGHYVMAYFLKRQPNKLLVNLSSAVMIIGTLMAAYAMLAGKASVLYTFYPPLKAHPLFYLGAALLIVGSWIALFSWIPMYIGWKKDNPGKKVPLAVVGNMANFAIWFVCTLAVAYEVLVMLLPWSLGWKDAINIPLSRTLFWFFGHALVYFWLLPAYILYYTALPKLAGGKLYSDNAGRAVFMLFLIFSIPIGVHHQFADPGIQGDIKFLQSIMTFGVAIPSLITAFTIAASLEYAGRKRGSKTLLGWMFKLPFLSPNNYLFSYLICGMFLFIFGGLTGLVNASFSLNSVVHNTSWMPGHFHMTVAGPVFLGIVGFGIYMLSKVMRKKVRFKKLLVVMPYLWVIGMLIFSGGLMWGGLLGEPRRTNLGLSYLSPDNDLFRPDWVPTTTLALIGGIIMTVGFLFYFISFVTTLFAPSTEPDEITYPESETIHQEKQMSIFSSFKPWLALMVVLCIMAYIPAIVNTLKYTGKDAPPFYNDGTTEQVEEPEDVSINTTPAQIEPIKEDEPE